MKALPGSATLACFSGVPITVEARIVECNCDITLGGDRAPTLFSLDPSPLLLVPPDTTDPPTDHGDWFPLTLDPLSDHPDPLPLGKVVTVTGSFDRPEAALCTYTEWGGVPTVDPSCRSVFVVTDISKPRP